MSNVGSIATIASLIGVPARTSMLVNLMDGRWLSAGELCRAAGVTPSTGSGHLRQLLEGGLLAVHQRGRHRYYQIAGPSVASAIETLLALSADLDACRGRRIRTGPADLELRYARVCYDHLAGELSVAIAKAMQTRGELELRMDGGALTRAGEMLLLDRLSIRVGGAASTELHFCRPCLDWSERVPHIGGELGRALLRSFSDNGWIRRRRASRTVLVTPSGRQALEGLFGELPALATTRRP